MKYITLIILATGLFLGFASSSYAVRPDSTYSNNTNIRPQQNQATGSPETILGYSQILIERSSVAAKLRLSGNNQDKARYTKAMEIHQEATQALQDGNFNKAKILALESIRVIAQSVPQYYNRIANANR